MTASPQSNASPPDVVLVGAGIMSATLAVILTAASVMINVIEQCFPGKLKPVGWLPKLKEMIPSYGQSLIDDADLCQKVRADTAAVLHLRNVTS